jgi:hypothetical protein
MEPKDKKPQTDVHPESDGLEASPEFMDQMEDMDSDFFEQHDPEFAALLKKHNKAEDADQGST